MGAGLGAGSRGPSPGFFTKANTGVKMRTSRDDWIVDSGASMHVCGNIRAFNYYTPMEKGKNGAVLVGDSTPLPVVGKGQVILKLTSSNILILNDVFYVPNIGRNLISVYLLGKAGIRVLFDFDKTFLIKNNIFMGKGYCYEGVYILECREVFTRNIPRLI
ncbi:hypothetical protein PVL29_007934 [Vitis rotundifolia]|uniref:Retrovirus-related Pol polyprotein from transposon TNT 1-94-like beta-barrel domain-containing protein n=1 Tax=Vitis rotundifolia TaxID=103349 RepID=A0AA39A395_VITRO|nr:hypothetical protein PVL29_007934 [Vitis rotundifolia]